MSRRAELLKLINQVKSLFTDNLGVCFSRRVWWMFRTMGHQQISVLNGGLPDWINTGFCTEPKISAVYEDGDFISLFNGNTVKIFEFVQNNIAKQEYLLTPDLPIVLTDLHQNRE